MNDQLIAGHILRKFRPRRKMKLRRFSRVLADPVRQLLRADVTALAMMRTALGNKDRISVLYHFQRFCALCRLFQIPLIPRKQNGKGSQTHLQRRQPVYQRKYLAVRDYQCRSFFQFCKRLRKFTFPADKRHRTDVQQIPDDLLLRQNQPPLRRRLVNRNNQNYRIKRFY